MLSEKIGGVPIRLAFDAFGRFFVAANAVVVDDRHRDDVDPAVDGRLESRRVDGNRGRVSVRMYANGVPQSRLPGAAA